MALRHQEPWGWGVDEEPPNFFTEERLYKALTYSFGMLVVAAGILLVTYLIAWYIG